MSNDNDTTKTASDTFVFTDIEGEVLVCDNNPAHFEGYLYEVSQCIKRTGAFLPLLEQRVVITPGGKTIVDSVSAVPFVLNEVAGAKTYTIDDPCPRTAQRIRHAV